MAEGAESTSASIPATDGTTEKAATTDDKTAAVPASATEEIPPAAESTPKGTGDETESTKPSSGQKRKGDGETNTDSTTIKPSTAPADTKPKKAKIAMPPSVSSSITNVEKYSLESPPPENNTNEADVTKKITTANLMLFGLHPLIKAAPLQKMLEDYGTVKAITVRSAFASRYCHVSFGTAEEARRCYVAIHGAKLLHKTFLVQPSSAAVVQPAPAKSDDKSPAAGAAHSAGAA
eukprot:CAMPEP_0197192278 /NCGR_PEP_ID=MMETSP1423-20130617/24808_1 /TAXON_ID=476441 /ORGANISM="Pseudo-nitzschia heimii, Strain UNC1101" /LENGTH=234 /DNA_ID=CAMNT_0042645129 /DNA_START=170 /DNA_END=870 /DNA_ORIENTATION=+